MRRWGKPVLSGRGRRTGYCCRRGNHLQQRSGDAAAQAARSALPALRRVAALLFAAFGLGQASRVPKDRALKLYNLHTDETRDDRLQAQRRLRPGRPRQAQRRSSATGAKNKPTKMDPHLFDLLWQVYQAVRLARLHPRRLRLSLAGRPTPCSAAARTASPRTACTCRARRWTSSFPACRSPSCARSACGCRSAASASIRPPARPSSTWTPASSAIWPRMTRQQLVARLPERQDAARPLRRQAAARLRPRRSPPTRRATGSPRSPWHLRPTTMTMRAMCRYRALRRSTRPRRAFRRPALPRCLPAVPTFRRSSGAASRSSSRSPTPSSRRPMTSRRRRCPPTSLPPWRRATSR